MIGLLYIGFFGVYLLLSGWLTDWAARRAKKRGIAGWKWGLPMALLMYHLVFWDWVPTVVAHQYYCSKYGGFTVYKTLEEWKKENPGVAETLQAHRSIQSTPYGDLQTLDERFAIETYRKPPIFLLSTKIVEKLIVDTKTSEVLAKGINIGSGYRSFAVGGSFKLWLKQKPCINNDFWNFKAEIKNMREGK